MSGKHNMQKNFGLLTFGFDIGIASVGWAVLNENRIVALGVRTFDKAENEKGEPLNLARREKRTTRTRLERRALRLKKLRRLLRNAGLVSSADPTAFITPPRDKYDPPNDPWHLRAEGLNRMLTPDEWARVIYHLVKHRGFYAARKTEMIVDIEAANEKAKEKQGTLNGIARTEKLLGTPDNPRYRTLGEMAAKDEAFAQAKRNKAGSYSNSFARKLLRDELRLLFEKQRGFGNSHAHEALYAEVDDLFWYQKPALSGEDMLNRLGRCTFEKVGGPDGKGEYRAAKHTWSAERFVWLTKLNNLRIVQNGQLRSLNEAERQEAINLPYDLSKLTYKQLRDRLNKHLDFPKDWREASFAGLSYRVTQKKNKKGEITGEKKPEEVENATLMELSGWHELRKAFERTKLESSWQRISQDHVLLDEIGSALSLLKTDDELRGRLAELSLNQQEIEALLTVSFSNFIRLSLKALRNILPRMEQGLRYDEACMQAGYNHSQTAEGEKSRTLPPLDKANIRNPVVFRSLNQARKVLNALVYEYDCSPVAVHIELGRDLSKSLDERKEIKKGQETFRDEKEQAIKLFKDTFNGREPNARNQDLLKFRLYREQDSQCPYCQQPLEIERLLETPPYAEIDHALPYSRSFDDSQNNKVLVHIRCNRDKGNRTPFEYLDGVSSSQSWRQFEAWVRGHKSIRKAKRDRLLRQHFDEREAREFAERNLSDTRYATKYFAKFVKENLKLAKVASEQPVRTPSGAFTSFLRARWGLLKNREQSDLHHALDACVIAAASHSLIKHVSDFHRRNELVQLPDGSFADRATGEILSREATLTLGDHFPKPWDNFRDELLARLSTDPKAAIVPEFFPQYSAEDIVTLKPVWVSRAPKRRSGGALHQETIRSAKFLDKGLSSANVKLQDLKLADLDKIVGAFRLGEDGKPLLDIEGKPIQDPRNTELISVLRKRLEAHENDGKKAFAEPVYKPSAPGKQAPLVRTVKLLSTQKSGVLIRGGIADQGEMIYVDIYRSKKKYLIEPAYAIDGDKRINRPTIPQDAEYLFSLSKNDYVKINFGSEKHEGYFVMYESDGRLTLRGHDQPMVDKTYFRRGIASASIIEKYQVDVLGNLYPARPEKRRDLA